MALCARSIAAPPHQSRERSFGHAIYACTGKSGSNRHVASNDDDTGPVVHDLRRCLDANERRAHIDCDNAVKVGEAEFLNTSERKNAGAVNKDVKSAEFCDSLPDSPLHLFGMQAVCLDRQDPSSDRLNLSKQSLSCGRGSRIGEHDICAVRGKPTHDTRTDAA